ncbi:MAG: hypothetical protein HYU59_05180 [Magnetospirillum gryphiswaldense]|nr:hypothetical protein [Magnetospirillum gryphiswaldense]
MSYFTYNGISSVLQQAGSAVGVFPLRDWHGQNGVILRHDVDLDVVAAYEFSRVLVECGVRSTFFFLTSAETYNVCSGSVRKTLKALADDGFEVALHFDPQIYPQADQKALIVHARAEGDLLADIIGQPVNSVSLHNPSVHGNYILFDGWNNAYDPAIFAPDRYLSDSCMRFRSDPQEFLTQANQTIVQLLLHPLHYTASGAAYPHPMLNYLRSNVQVVDNMFRVNPEYQERVGDGLVGALMDDLTCWKA